MHQEKTTEKGFFRALSKESRWALSFVKQDRGKVLAFAFLNLISVCVGMAGSVASKYLIDGVVAQSRSALVYPILLITFAAVLHLLLSSFSGRLSVKASIGTDNRLRGRVFHSVLRAKWASLADFQNGELINRLNGDVHTVSSGAVSWIPTLCTRLLQFFAALIIICFYDPVMALIALAGAPVTLILSRFLLKKLRAYQEKQRMATGKIISFQEDTFRNLKTVKSFGLAGKMEEEMGSLQEEYRSILLNHHIFTLLISAFMSILGMITAYVCFGWSAFRLWEGEIQFGTMVLFLQLSGSLSGAFSALASMVPQLIGITTSAGRLMRICDLPEEPAFAETGSVSGPVTVRAEHLSFAYDRGKPVFLDASFLLKPGEITALVGPSGVGKSTLFSLLLGLCEPIDGSLTVLDAKGEAVPEIQMRSCFSLVPQGNTLLSGTVRDNLLLGDEQADDAACRKALRLAEAEGFVDRLGGLDAALGEQGRCISEGQAQRIAIARALLRKAPVLLLDEATASLDEQTQQKIFENLRTVCKDRAILTATHRKAVLPFCDRVLTIADGKIVEQPRL